MTRPLRTGDRVSATGTVTYIGSLDIDVQWDPADPADKGVYEWGHAPRALILIEPAEPPVGSVVVKDGVAWTRYSTQALDENDVSWWECSGSSTVWEHISDGTVIHTPGETP
jgi:hypothetical protein